MKATYNLLSKYRDELFGLAILLIIVFHYTEDFHQTEHNACPELIFTAIEHFFKYVGSIGVEMFAFLSGMGLTYAMGKNPDLKEFYRRRYSKIILPYVIVGSISWIICDLVLRGRGIGRMLRDFFFVTFFTEGDKSMWYILFVLIVYAVYPLIFRLIRAESEEKQTLRCLTVIAVYITVWMIYCMTFPETVENIEILFNRILIFLMGVLFTGAIRSERRIASMATILLILFYFVLNQLRGKINLKGFGSMTNRWHDAMWAILLMLGAAMLFELLHMKGNSILCWFGKYTLEIYLIHVTLRKLLHNAGLYKNANIVRYALLIAASLALAPVLNLLVSRISLLLSGNRKKTA